MLVFFVIVVLVVLIIYLSGISVKIEGLEIEKNEKIEIKEFEINICFLLFNKIRVLNIPIKKELIEKINFNKIFDRFKGKNLKQDRNIISRGLKELKIKVKTLNIYAKIGLSDPVFLAYLVAIFNIALSIIYAKIAEDYRGNYRYKIEQCQNNKIYLKLSINCIINIKIANIINMIIKNRSEVGNERTSNRSFDGNSYEQYTRYGRCKHYYRSTN